MMHLYYMKTKKLKRKLDFIYTYKFLNNNKSFVFEYINKNSLTDYKNLSKKLIYSLSLLNNFVYKYPLHVKKNNEVCNYKNVIFIKKKSFFFQSSNLFEKCVNSFFIRFQTFLSYYLLFIFVLLKRKNG
jgi:hypothetical protein